MLATLVIGLREGLEAALIVGIIAAFLKRNGHSLIAMWWGVSAALVASLGVGVALWSLEATLPQAAQEGLETVIGAVAVVFVTGMIVWMGSHARTMKRDLEAEAADALGVGTARALAVMAFLAVLKEGFETSVFLLATFRAAVTPGVAATGALIGIAAAIAIGIGIYSGGVRLNLARFFRITGVFLVLVAAGLTLTALRTAHEAGWVNGGQARTVDLSWLAPPGSIQASLVTGVLGIPADPRVIEVLAWFAYLIPVGLIMFLPDRLKPHGRSALRFRLGLATALVASGVAVAVAGSMALAPGGAAPLRLSSAPTSEVGGTVVETGRGIVLTQAGRTTRVATVDAGTADRHGLTTTTRTASLREMSSGPATLDLDTLVSDNGGRIPVGIDPARATGPFTASWATVTAITTWSADGRLVDVQTSTTRVLTVAGGGLTSARTITVGTATTSAATTASVDRALAAVTADQQAVLERPLWAVQIPLILVVAGVLLAISTLSRRRRAERAAALRTSGSTSYAIK